MNKLTKAPERTVPMNNRLTEAKGGSYEVL